MISPRPLRIFFAAALLLGLAAARAAQSPSIALPLKAKSEPGPVTPPTVALLKTEAASLLLEPRIATFDALLFSELAARPEMILVEREDLDAAFAEFRLPASAATSSTGAVLVGRWSGAGVVIAPRAVARGPGLTVAARILGVDTGLVLVADTSMESGDHFASGARELAAKIATLVQEKHARLLPPPFDESTQLEALRTILNNGAPPTVSLAIRETRGAGPATSAVANPVIAEELARIWQALGGRLSLENNEGQDSAALLLRIEARAWPGPRHGDFSSGRAQIALVAVDRSSGRELLTDHQTEIALESSEALALELAQRRAIRALGFRLLRALADTHRP